MRITFLAHDLGSNAFGRAHVLAQLAARFADVEIVGPSSTGQIWEPLRNDLSIPVRLIEGRMPKVADAVESRPDVIVAVKARHASLGLGLRAARKWDLPLMVDVDDWELAFYYENRRWWLKQCVNLADPNNFWLTMWAERRVKKAHSVTVASTFLQKRFGGEIVVHARDCKKLSPKEVDPLPARVELGVSQDERVVLFMGSPKPHKGLADVVAAIDMISDPMIKFVVVGAGSDLPKRPWLTVVGNRPFSEIPRYLAAADVVVLAQRPSSIAKAQLPAKVFDAMAMARPVVSTDVADLRVILGRGGILVPANNIASLADAIRSVVTEPHLARSMSLAARARFCGNYCFHVVAPIFQRAVYAAVRGEGGSKSKVICESINTGHTEHRQGCG